MLDHFLCFLTVFCCVSFVKLPAIDDLQYITSSLLIGGCLVYRKSGFFSKTSLKSLLWSVLMFFGILSVLWSEVMSYYTLELGHLFLFVLTFLSFRKVFSSSLGILCEAYLSLFSVLAITGVLLYFLLFGFQDVVSWSYLMDGNINYGYCYILFLLLFLFSNKSVVVRNIGFVLFLVFLPFIYKAGIIGIYLLGLLVFLYAFVLLLNVRLGVSLVLGLSVMLFAGLLGSSFFLDTVSLDVDVLERVHYLSSSIDILKTNPVLGVGLGQWTEWYQNLFLNASNSSQATHGFLPIVNHSLFSKFLVELGVVGVLLFYTPILVSIYDKIFRKPWTVNLIHYLFLIAFFIIASEIYASVQFKEGHFSNVLFLCSVLFAKYDTNIIIDNNITS